MFDCNTSKWVTPLADRPPNWPVSHCTPLPYYSPDLKDIKAGLRDSIDPMIQGQMGLCGVPKVLNAASPTTAVGDFYCQIQIITDTVLNVTPGNTRMIDGNGADVDLSALSAITITKGTTLLGNWTEINLVSGVVIVLPHPFL